MLILIVALGIALTYARMPRRVLMMNSISFATSEMRAISRPGRRLISRCSSVGGIALLISLVAVGIIEPQSQSVVPRNSAVGAEFYLKRGEDYSAVHDYDRAIADYTTAIELKPDYAEAYNDRGFAYYLKGDFDRAIADYTRAIELRPNYPKAYNNRGVVYMAGGHGKAKSVPDFDRAIELKPDFRYAYINRANARLFSHPRLALQDFHRAGMYPERTIAIVAGILMVAVAVALLVLRRRQGRGTSVSNAG